MDYAKDEDETWGCQAALVQIPLLWPELVPLSQNRHSIIPVERSSEMLAQADNLVIVSIAQLPVKNGPAAASGLLFSLRHNAIACGQMGKLTVAQVHEFVRVPCGATSHLQG